MSNNTTGIVFNIQRFSIHDGPGIRTVVFEKGCPLKCKWCANPESQSSKIELAWTKSKCINCKTCVQANLKCNPHFKEDGVYWDSFEAQESEMIRKTCPSEALHSIGRVMNVKEVFEQIDRDEIFYSNLDGGLTISGGEPLMQPEFTYELLSKAKRNGIHTAIETTGYANTEIFLKIAGKLDYLLMDIKALDDEKHFEWTGVHNEQILKNFLAVREKYPNLPIQIRTPVIPGVNDDEESIKAIHDFICDFDKVKYEILKYHKFGESKYESLHRPYPMGDVELSQELFDSLKQFEFDNINKPELWEDGGGI